MPFLLNEASVELKGAVQVVENRADKCYELLRLLKRPANEARWSLLTAIALELEVRQQKFGANRPLHKIAMVTLDRCTCGFKFITEHGKLASRLVQKYTWHGSLIQEASHALQVSEQYMHFLGVFPLWHKNHEGVDRSLPSNKAIDLKIAKLIRRPTPGRRISSLWKLRGC